MRIYHENHFVSHDGEKLYYRHWPAANPNAPVIMLFHRGHEHSGRMAHVVDEIDLPDFQFFAWDARGYGQSPGLRGDAPNVACMARDAEIFFRLIKAKTGVKDQDIAIIGQSVGAVIASTWVHDYVPNIRAMVLAAPAFKVKLYVPFAIPGLKLMYNFRGNFFVNSYVKSNLLTHDKERIASFDADPLIARPISTRLLIDLFETSKRIVADSAAITVPTQVLVSGKDYVVFEKPQQQFFNALNTKKKEYHKFDGFYHDTLGEANRALPIKEARRFILENFASAPCSVNLLAADTTGYTHAEAQSLLKPPGIFKKMHYALQRAQIRYAAQLSDGVKLGMETGFDSGSTLDYVYRNQASGVSSFGRFSDYLYLQAIGWRGIRQRKVNIETIFKEAALKLVQDRQALRIMDIAAGHGRYVLDAISQTRPLPESVLLRDYSDINIEKGSKLIEQKGLQEIAQFVKGDAFDFDSLAGVGMAPTLSIVSGLYELFPDNTMVSTSLKGVAAAMSEGGYLIYTNQPWHPQLEYIARVLTSHREGQAWVMRRRTQAEMDQLVADAGFEKIDMLIDEWGIFTVSLARRKKAD